MNRPAPRRAHLLEVAQSLFNQHGYHRTGIDAIMNASGVSKTTLYKHFRTKEDLVLELLDVRSRGILEAMEAQIADAETKAMKKNGAPATAAQRVAAIIDVVDDWVGGEAFCGCNFIRAVSEYETENAAITDRARAHKAAVKDLIETQLDAGTKTQRALTAEQIMVTIDGAIVSAHVRQRGDAMKSARRLVELVLA